MAKKVKQKEINFLAVLAGSRSRKKIQPRSLILPLALLLVIGVGLGVYSFISSLTHDVNSESNDIRAYLNSPETTRLIAEADSIETQAQNMQATADRVALPMENLATYPDLTTEDYSRILGYAGANIEITIMRYDRTTGILRFTATSDFVPSVPTFISLLRHSGIFSSVAYSGYSSNVSPARQQTGTTQGQGYDEYDADENSVAPLYAFSVECMVKPPDAPLPYNGTPLPPIGGGSSTQGGGGSSSQGGGGSPSQGGGGSPSQNDKDVQGRG